MARSGAPRPPSIQVSDAQLKHDLEVLAAEEERAFGEWEADFVRAGRPEPTVNDTLGRRLSFRFYAIGQTFWRLREEAYFECCLRHKDIAFRGRPGRPPKHFRWLRVVPTFEARRPGPKRSPKEAAIVRQATMLVRQARQAGSKLSIPSAIGAARHDAGAVTRLDALAKQRLKRAVARALQNSPK